MIRSRRAAACGVSLVLALGGLTLATENGLSKQHPDLATLNNKILELQSRLPVSKIWRPAKAERSGTFPLDLSPEMAIVTLLEWRTSDEGSPRQLDSTPSLIVAQNAAATLQVSTEDHAKSKLTADTLCRIRVALSNKTLVYSPQSCPEFVPSFKVMFLFGQSMLNKP